MDTVLTVVTVLALALFCLSGSPPLFMVAWIIRNVWRRRRF